MGMAVFAIAANATYQVGHLQQQLYTTMRSIGRVDMVVLLIAAIATHQVGRRQQHVHTYGDAIWAA